MALSEIEPTNRWRGEEVKSKISDNTVHTNFFVFTSDKIININ